MYSLPRTITLTLALMVSCGSALADDLKVMISGGFSAAYEPLVADFEAKTGTHVVTVHGASMGATPTAIPNRLARGEASDIVILAAPALADLVKLGYVDSGSVVALARSKIGLAVRTGTAKPDISTAEGLKAALLAAKAVVYSTSASGVYLTTTLFPKLGIADQLNKTGRTSPTEPAGAVVARGEADLALQQISELKPVGGIDIVGPIPEELQLVTVFSAAMSSRSQNTTLANAFLAFVQTPAAAEVIKSSGMEPTTLLKTQQP